VRALCSEARLYSYPPHRIEREQVSSAIYRTGSVIGPCCIRTMESRVGLPMMWAVLGGWSAIRKLARTLSRKKRRSMRTAAAWRTGSLAVGMLRLLSSKLLY